MKGISSVWECPFSMPKIFEGGAAMTDKTLRTVGVIYQILLSELQDRRTEFPPYGGMMLLSSTECFVFLMLSGQQTVRPNRYNT